MSEINNQINALTAYAQMLKLTEQYTKGLLSESEYERKAKEVIERFAERFTPESEQDGIDALQGGRAIA